MATEWAKDLVAPSQQMRFEDAVAEADAAWTRDSSDTATGSLRDYLEGNEKGLREIAKAFEKISYEFVLDWKVWPAIRKLGREGLQITGLPPGMYLSFFGRVYRGSFEFRWRVVRDFGVFDKSVYAEGVIEELADIEDALDQLNNWVMGG